MKKVIKTISHWRHSPAPRLPCSRGPPAIAAGEKGRDVKLFARLVVATLIIAAQAQAQEPAPSSEPTSAPTRPPEARHESAAGSPSLSPRLQIHGFVSEGGFVSSSNDYLGHPS